MSKNEGFSSNQLKIIEVCKVLYQNGRFFEKCLKNQPYQGYLIEKNIIDQIKKKINYEKLKELVFKEQEAYIELQKQLKNNNEKIPEIIPKTYNNSKELIKDLLNANKSYYIIKNDQLIKITNQDKLIKKEVKFSFGKDIIIFTFNERDILNFTNNNDGVISKTFLLKANLTNSTNRNISNDDGKNKGISKSFPNDKIKFNKDLEILTRIFYYNKYLREKENDTFKKLNKDENGETVYLIHNYWMEKYRSYFNYQYLESYLINKKEYNEQFTQNNYYFSDQFIKDIIDNLPIDYINKINNKDKFKSKLFQYEFNTYNKDLKYTFKNHIINYKVYKLLIELEYNLNESMKQLELYFVGNKKLLLKFDDIGSKKNIDEIGFINDKGIFIPEYILDYENDNNISLDNLNKFFKQKILNFYKYKNNEKCEIKNEQNKVIGHCFKLENNSSSFITPGQNIDNNNPQLINKENNQSNEQIDKEINPYIELMINIYLFKEELKKKIAKDMKNTLEEKYFIIKKEWIDTFKQIFDYDNKFLKYINQANINNIKQIFNPNDNYEGFLSEIMKIFTDDKKRNLYTNMNDGKINTIKNIDNYLIKPIEKNNIYYYKNIEIINDKITYLIQKIFNVECHEKRIFLLGDNKIIMNFDYKGQYSIITGNYNNKYFEAEYLFRLYTVQNLDYCHKKFISVGYDKAMSLFFYPKKGGNIIFIKDESPTIIGELNKINDLENNIINVNRVNELDKNLTSQNEINTKNNNGNTFTTPMGNSNTIITINNRQQTQSQSQTSTPTIIQQIKLSDFLENQVKALISYYLFTENLKQKINSRGIHSGNEQNTSISKTKELHCYLIDNNWMKYYTQFFLYEEIIKQIQIILKIIGNEKTVEKIYEKIDNELLKKIAEKERTGIKATSNSNLKFIDSGNINNIIHYYQLKFNIIDEEILNYMNKTSEKVLTDVKSKEYIINEGKIFIKISDNNIRINKILICNFIIENNNIVAIPEKMILII